LYNQHQENYVKIEHQLLSCYKNYANQTTIVNLLEYWIFSVVVIYSSYGLKGVKGYFSSIQKDPVLFSYEFESNINSRAIPNVSKFSFMVKWLPFSLRLPAAPVNSFFDRISVKYTALLIRSIPATLDRNLEKRITEIVKLYLSSMNICVNNETSLNIPKVFTSIQIGKAGLKTEIYCSPYELMQFNTRGNIFLLNKKIEIIGYQHGGGYGVVNIGYISHFEKKISKIFYGWGLLEQNVHQYRYKKIHNFKKKKGRVIWLESDKLSAVLSIFYPLHYDLSLILKDIEYIYSELQMFGGKYYSKSYPGYLESNRYISMRGEKIGTEDRSEDIIKQNDIIIFDSCMSSMIYFCIENDMRFIIICNRNTKEYFTDRMAKWVDILRKNSFLFFSDEVGQLSTRLHEISSENTIPDEVASYHKKIFL